MFLEEYKLYTIYHHDKPDSNSKMIFTFPTSLGSKLDIINFGTLDSILNENIIFVFFQTNDKDYFYNNEPDEIKVPILKKYITTVETTMPKIIKKYSITSTPVLLGCSMGGYYAQLFYFRNPSQFHCISLGGVCSLSTLDRNGTNKFDSDKVIDYWKNQKLWKEFDPIQLQIKRKQPTKALLCFGCFDDNDFIVDTYYLYGNLPIWNYIKIYMLGHNFPSWTQMIYDIFKNSNTYFHDFRIDFYK